MKQRKNFIKSDIGISSNLREITQFDFKSGKIGWPNFIYTCYSVCVCVCVCGLFSYALFRTSLQITVASEIGHILQNISSSKMLFNH